jgi:hypothetical protein
MEHAVRYILAIGSCRVCKTFAPRRKTAEALDEGCHCLTRTEASQGYTR